MAVNDIYTDGRANGWKIINGSELNDDLSLEADVAIIGTGAGGGIAAEVLSQAGLKVIMLESGSLQTAHNFKDMDEARAFGTLYQEGGARSTDDGNVALLQGRTVGGSTTVNYTSSFRTPESTLKHWADAHQVSQLSAADLAPWFAKAEQRLNITPWTTPANANNAVLSKGCEQLNWQWGAMQRNVKGCWDLGYCGFGCPTNAKQSMLTTTIPAALQANATLIYHARAQHIHIRKERADGIVAHALGPDSYTATGHKIKIKARHYIVATGAINSPALLMRSEAPDPYSQLGQRTTIHPVNVNAGYMPDEVAGYYGAPQSVYSDQFNWEDGITGAIGYKLEVGPAHPMLASVILGGHGQTSAERVKQLPNVNLTIAILRDGFHADSPGGEVYLDDNGWAKLRYDFTDHLWDGLRRSFINMAECQFAAGAKKVMPSHLNAKPYNTFKEAKQAINQFDYSPGKLTLFSAHLMGGCAMSDNPKLGVCDSQGKHHQVHDLSILDGSLFPTSIGANPQLSIYGLVYKLATALSRELKT